MGSSMLPYKEDYQSVSRLDKTPGQIPSTSRNLYELICVVNGSVEYWIEDQFYKINRGDILIIPSGVMVGANLKQRGCPLQRHSLWLSHKFMAFLKLQDPLSDYIFNYATEKRAYMLRPTSDIYSTIASFFESIEQSAESNLINRELCCKAAVSLLLAELNQNVHLLGDISLLPGSKNRISPVIRYIHEHCTEAITVDKLAEVFSFSSSHLAHSFKKQLGISIYQYILLRRLQIGRQAMLDGVPVRDAYQKCGFGDYAGFYRAFIKEYGMSPQQYKKKHQ